MGLIYDHVRHGDKEDAKDHQSSAKVVHGLFFGKP